MNSSQHFLHVSETNANSSVSLVLVGGPWLVGHCKKV